MARTPMRSKKAETPVVTPLSRKRRASRGAADSDDESRACARPRKRTRKEPVQVVQKSESEDGSEASHELSEECDDDPSSDESEASDESDAVGTKSSCTICLKKLKPGERRYRKMRAHHACGLSLRTNNYHSHKTDSGTHELVKQLRRERPSEFAKLVDKQKGKSAASKREAIKDVLESVNRETLAKRKSGRILLPKNQFMRWLVDHEDASLRKAKARWEMDLGDDRIYREKDSRGRTVLAIDKPTELDVEENLSHIKKVDNADGEDIDFEAVPELLGRIGDKKEHTKFKALLGHAWNRVVDLPDSEDDDDEPRPSRTSSRGPTERDSSDGKAGKCETVRRRVNHKSRGDIGASSNQLHTYEIYIVSYLTHRICHTTKHRYYFISFMHCVSQHLHETLPRGCTNVGTELCYTM